MLYPLCLHHQTQVTRFTFVVRCLLSAVRCPLSAVCCPLSAVCCLRCRLLQECVATPPPSISAPWTSPCASAKRNAASTYPWTPKPLLPRVSRRQSHIRVFVYAYVHTHTYIHTHTLTRSLTHSLTHSHFALLYTHPSTTHAFGTNK